MIRIKGGKDFLLGLAQGRSSNSVYHVTRVLKSKTICLDAIDNLPKKKRQRMSTPR